MSLEIVKNKLISDILEELKCENESRLEFDKMELDIPRFIVLLEAYLIDKFSNFLKDIGDRGYTLNGFENGDSSYVDGIISLLVYEKDYLKSIKSNSYCYNGDSDWMHYDYEYQIEFGTVNHGTEDWFAPKLEIKRIELENHIVWDKGEYAYEEFIKSFDEKKYINVEE